MNPIAMIVTTVLAIAGGAGGSMLVSRLQESKNTKTGDAFDDTTTALMLTPAAPYAGAAKVLRPFAERGAKAVAKEFAKKPPAKKSQPKPPQPTCEEPMNDAGFVSVGNVPPAPPKPSPYFTQCTVVNGKKVCKNHPYPKALYDQAMARWKVEYAKWEAARKSAVAFDRKLAEDKAALEEQLRRSKAQAELDALRNLVRTPAAPTRSPSGRTPIPGSRTSPLPSTQPYPGTQPPPNVPLDPWTQPPQAAPFDPWMEPPQTTPFDPWMEAQPYPYSQPPMSEWLDNLPFGGGADIPFDPFEFDGMFGAHDLSELDGVHDEGGGEIDVGNADSACCVSCAIGAGGCASGTCG